MSTARAALWFEPARGAVLVARLGVGRLAHAQQLEGGRERDEQVALRGGRVGAAEEERQQVDADARVGAIDCDDATTRQGPMVSTQRQERVVRSPSPSTHQHPGVQPVLPPRSPHAPPRSGWAPWCLSICEWLS
eukprot:6674139-Prymnesium_polylepis.1